MTETELRSLIKSGPRGGFLFWGEEDYLKKHYLAQIRQAVLAECPPGLEQLNRLTLTLEDGDYSALASAILAPPMMAPVKIVEVTPPSLDAIREKDRKNFLSALGEIAGAPDTVLVVSAPRGTLDTGTPSRPTAYFKNLTAVLTPVEFPLQTGVRLRRWVERHFADAGLTAPEDTVTALLTRCPADMTGLAGEIDKLIAYELSHGRTIVPPEDVPLVTSPGMREDSFALANAVLAGDRTAALRALDVYRKRKEEPIAVMASLSRVMCDLLTVASLMEGGLEKADIARALKMHEYKATLYMKSASSFGIPRLTAAVRRCREADRLMKSASMDYIPLERFVCTIPRAPAVRTPGESAPKG